MLPAAGTIHPGIGGLVTLPRVLDRRSLRQFNLPRILHEKKSLVSSGNIRNISNIRIRYDVTLKK